MTPSASTKCQSVGISRSTFYRLFEDKYSIPTWCQDLALRAGLVEIGRTLTVQQGNIITLDGISLFRNLIYSAGRNQGENSFRSLLIKKHAAAMKETLEGYKHVAIDDELEFQIAFTAESQANAVYHWLDGAFEGDAPETFCLNMACHALTRDQLIQKTASMKRNVHLMPHENLDCGTCHKSHRASVNYCSKCHTDATIPDGWLTVEEEQALKSRAA